jgi:hypothetical protein
MGHRAGSRLAFRREDLRMRDRDAAAKLVVRVVFEPDRLAQASVERAYARLVPPTAGLPPRGPRPAVPDRGPAPTGRDE